MSGPILPMSSPWSGTTVITCMSILFTHPAEESAFRKWNMNLEYENGLWIQQKMLGIVSVCLKIPIRYIAS